MAILLENYLPVVKYNGINTAKSLTQTTTTGASLMKVNTTVGYVAVGSDTPVSNQDPQIPFYVNGTTNAYFGINVVNYSTGTTASADVVVINSQAATGGSTGFVDFGINGINWNDPTYATFDAGAGYVYCVDNNFYVGTSGTSTTGNLNFFTGGHNSKNFIRASVDATGNFIVGIAALATSATDGFLYIPTCPGAPSGVPTTKTGRIPMIYDTTNNFFYFYNGGWKKSTVYA